MFSYNTKIKYFEVAELKHLNKFIELEIGAGFVYRGKDGVAYHVLRTFQPEGLITPRTNYSRRALPDNSKNYACPDSAIADAKEFKIIYQIIGEEGQKTILSKEFLKKIGEDFEVFKADKDIPQWIEDIKESMVMKKAQAKATTDSPESFKDKSSVFTPNKRSVGKPSQKKK